MTGGRRWGGYNPRLQADRTLQRPCLVRPSSSTLPHPAPTPCAAAESPLVLRTTLALLAAVVLALPGEALAQTGEREDVPHPPHVEIAAELLTPLDSLQALVRYPRRFCIEGRVVVAVTVEPDGSVSGARVVQGIIPEADAEAVRVALLARFRPGEQRGVPIRSEFALPISFSIER